MQFYQKFIVLIIISFLSFDVSGQVDGDNDGMPRVWEEANNLSDDDPRDALCDLDGDHIINLFEFQLQSNPNDNNSPSSRNISLTTTQQEFENHLREAHDRPLVLRFEKGNYDLKYDTEIFSDLSDKAIRVMFQGGWDESHCTYEQVDFFENFAPHTSFIDIISPRFIINKEQVSVSSHTTFILETFFTYGNLVDFKSGTSDAFLSLNRMQLEGYNNNETTALSFLQSTSTPFAQFSMIQSAVGYGTEHVRIRQEENAVGKVHFINACIGPSFTYEPILEIISEDGAILDFNCVNSSLWQQKELNGPAVTLEQLGTGIQNIHLDHCYAKPIRRTNSIGAEIITNEIANTIGPSNPGRNLGKDVGLLSIDVLPDLQWNRQATLSEEDFYYLDITGSCDTISGTVRAIAHIDTTYNVGGGINEIIPSPYTYMVSVDSENYVEQLELDKGDRTLFIRPTGTCHTFAECIEIEQDCPTGCDPALMDSDNDGMPNAWEVANGLDECDPLDAFCDYDGDKVINLFEYQLTTDPYDDSTPKAYNVDTPFNSDDLELLMVEAQDEPILIRMAEGIYDCRYDVSTANFPIDADGRIRLMIQGGWDSDFCDYDPFMYKTVSNSQGLFMRVLYGNSGLQERSSMIIEGLEMIGGGMDIVDKAGQSHLCLYNCSMTGTSSLTFSKENGDGDVHLLNTSFTDTPAQPVFWHQPFGKSINMKIRLVNTNFANLPNDNSSLLIITQDPVPLNVEVVNSNIWDKDDHLSITVLRRNWAGDEEQNLTVSYSNLTDTQREPGLGRDSFFMVTNQDAGFELESPPHYVLAPTSPLKEAGKDLGIPYQGMTPDIGVNQFAYSSFQLIDSIKTTQSSCNLDNGKIEIQMIEHHKDFEFSLNNKDRYTPLSKWNDLAAGEYVIYIRTVDNCAHFQQKITISSVDSMDDFTKEEIKATCGESNGSITIRPPSAISDYEYAIVDTTNFQASNVFSGLSANVYILYYRSVSDPDCIIRDVLILNQDSDIALMALDSTDTTCGQDNGGVELEVENADGTVSYFYTENSPQSSGTFTGLPSGSFNFIVEDDRGCRDSVVVSIENSAGIAIIDTLITQPTCGLDNGQLTVQTNDPGSVTDVTLNGIDGSLALIDLEPGSYNIVVTDNIGCSDEIDIILESSEPVEILSIDTIQTKCALDNGAVKVIQASGNPAVYSTDGNIYLPQESFTGLASGDYLLYAQNDICADTLAFSIGASTQPELSIATADGTDCGEDSGSVELAVLNGIGPYTYALDSLNNINGTFESLPAGEYVAYVQDFADCRDSTDVDIATSVPVVLSATVQEGLCGALGAIELSTSSGNNNVYTDQDGKTQNTAIYNQLQGGEYVFYVRTDMDCLDTVIVNVPVYSIPDLEVIDITPAYCEEPVGSFTVMGIGGKGTLSYGLSGEPLSSLSQYNNLEAGTYIMTVSDESGCTSIEHISVQATPRVRIEDLVAEPLFCGDFLSGVQFLPMGGTGELTYRLIDSEGNEIIEAEGLTEGQYRLIVKDEVGCESEELIMVRKEACDVYIPTTFDPSLSDDNKSFKLGVPKSSNFLIRSFRIYNRWGNLVYDQENINPLTFADWWDGRIDGRLVESGVYTYALIFDGDKISMVGTVTITY